VLPRGGEGRLVPSSELLRTLAMLVVGRTAAPGRNEGEAVASSSPNTTNHQRIARALHRATGCGYQKALQRVQAAADAGRLPARLDRAGREEAVRMLTEYQPQPAPAVEASAPVAGAQPSALAGLVRGGLDKTVAVVDIGALARQGDRELSLFDLEGLSSPELAFTLHRAMERRRSLEQKERVVAAMRAERDRNLHPFPLLPAVPEALREQLERLAAQTRRKPPRGKP
jgi:hypothetical protein